MRLPKTLLLFFTTLTLGCSQPPGPENALMVYIGPQPSDLRWSTNRDIIGIGVIYNIMEGLLAVDLSSPQFKVIPRLAKEFSHVNHKQWTFKLRHDVLWNDKVPLTAQHFADAFEYVLTPGNGSAHAQRFLDIVGAKDFYNQKSPYSKVAIKAVDKTTLTITLKKSDPTFPQRLAGFFSFPIRKDKLIMDEGRPQIDPRITLGPYQVSEQKNDKTCLTANPHYWGKTPAIKNLCFLWLENRKTALRLFRKKQLDFVRSPDFEDVVALNLMDHYNSSPTHGLYYLAFNTKSAPTNSLIFRKKIRTHIESLPLQKIAGANFDRLASIYPPSLSGKHRSLPKPIDTTQTDKAAPVGTQPPKVILTSNNTPFHEKLLTYINRSLQDDLGIASEIKMLEVKNLLKNLSNNPQFQIYRMSWIPAVVSRHSYASLWTSDSVNNFTGYKDKNYDLLVSKAFSSKPGKERDLIYHKLEEKIIEQDNVVIPLFTHKQSFLIRSPKYSMPAHPSERVDFIEVKINP